MEQSPSARALIGPNTLLTFGLVVVVLFLAFLWVFNFTSFF